MRKILPFALALVLLAFLLAGCGGGAESPGAVVNKIIKAYRASDAAAGGRCFGNPQMYPAFIEMIPDTAIMHTANERIQDEQNATVDLILAPRADAGGFTMVMGNSGSGWKVMNWTIK